MKTVQIAVRDFALPVPRRGSIDVHSGYNLLAQGQEIHEHVQRERKKEDPYYKSEVKVSHTFVREPYRFAVSGRIDGIFDRFPLLVEEIKSTVNIHQLKAKLELQEDHPYILQAKTYAYLYYLQHGLLPQLRLHLISSTNYSIAENLDINVDIQQYEAWLEKRLAELIVEMQTLEADIMRRIDLSASLRFPFSQPRSGQLDLMAAVEQSIKDGRQLMVQAATGLGKTIAIMFPTLKDALSRGQKLVYVTPKNSQHSVAEEAVARLQVQAAPGEELRVLTLTAKSKICFKPEPICTPELCEYARDYYKKMDEHKLLDLAATKATLNFDAFRELGAEYEVCPFELSIDAIARADIVVGDYNYVFSPRSLLGRITQHNDLLSEKPNLVIDEAHNLPDRACDYYSPSINTLRFEDALKEARLLPAGLSVEAQALASRSLEIIKQSGKISENSREAQIKPDPLLFEEQDKRWREFLARYLQSGQELKQRDGIIRAANAWSQFSEGLDFDSDHFFITARGSAGGTDLKITCCDASPYLKDIYDEFRAAVAFSATLKPFEYYMRLSGFGKDRTSTVECNSPFPLKNRKILVIPQVSTKYSDRSKNYDKIADAIKRIVELRRGNYFAFFPSFAFLNEVALRVKGIDFEILSQRAEMKSEEVRSWIDRLRDKATALKPVLILAVQGGVFSEGVDFPGESLIGALIIGPALPKFDLERELLRAYYEEHYSSGFDYAYTYPAMTRVVQSAGRVIRSENDRGLIVLMDQRFVQRSYSGAMPGDWFQESVTELVSKSILKDISDFWQNDSRQLKFATDA